MGTKKQVTKMNAEAKKLFLDEVRRHIPLEEGRNVQVFFLKLKQGALLSLDGMLCEAYLKSHDLKWDGYLDNACLGQTHVMPKQVAEWAGFPRLDPYIEYKGNITTLSQFNDGVMPNISEELIAYLDSAL